MGILNDSQLEEFNNNGFLLVKGIIPQNPRNNLLKCFKILFNKYANQSNQVAHDNDSWLSSDLNEKLIGMRRSHPKQFGALYDSLKLSISIHTMFCEKQIIDIVTSLLQEEPEGLCSSGHMLRLDPPYDTRNALDWHQDSAYYMQNKNGANGLVCWVPLVPVSSENGSIRFCPGSHNAGKINTQGVKFDSTTSEQFKVSEEFIERYGTKDFIAKPGDAGFFNMDIIHRSGENRSDTIRFAAACRYHRMLADDFTTGELQYIPHYY